MIIMMTMNIMMLIFMMIMFMIMWMTYFPQSQVGAFEEWQKRKAGLLDHCSYQAPSKNIMAMTMTIPIMIMTMAVHIMIMTMTIDCNHTCVWLPSRRCRRVNGSWGPRHSCENQRFHVVCFHLLKVSLKYK